MNSNSRASFASFDILTLQTQDHGDTMPGKRKQAGRGLSHDDRQLQVASLSAAQLPHQGVPARNRVRPAHSDNGSDRDECSDGSEMPGQGSVGNDDDDAEDSESVHFLWQAKKGLDHQSHLPCL